MTESPVENNSRCNLREKQKMVLVSGSPTSSSLYLYGHQIPILFFFLHCKRHLFHVKRDRHLGIYDLQVPLFFSPSNQNFTSNNFAASKAKKFFAFPGPHSKRYWSRDRIIAIKTSILTKKRLGFNYSVCGPCQ